MIRAASDLVATHFRPDGTSLTPEGVDIEHRSLDSGLIGLGRIADTLLNLEEPLALRCLQAGVAKNIVVHHLPGLGHLTEYTRQIATNASHDEGMVPLHLDALAPRWTEIRIDDPITELGDRMRRIRRHTFDLPIRRGDAVSTLRDIAVLGVTLHAHAAAFHGHDVNTAPEPRPEARGAQALVLRGRAWQGLHRDLSRFAALTPAIAEVRQDVLALRGVLASLAPLAEGGNTGASASLSDRRIGAALNGAIATMADIADDNSRTFKRLTRTSDLLIDIKHVPRDLISDDPALVELRLHGGYARAPEAAVADVLKAYHVVRAQPSEPIAPLVATAAMISDVEREIASLSLTASRGR